MTPWKRSGRSTGKTRAPSIARDRKSTRLNSSHLGISYAVFCLKKKKKINSRTDEHKDTTKLLNTMRKNSFNKQPTHHFRQHKAIITLDTLRTKYITTQHAADEK